MAQFNIIQLSNPRTGFMFSAQVLVNGDLTCTATYTVENTFGDTVFHDEFTFFDSERAHITCQLLETVKIDFMKYGY